MSIPVLLDLVVGEPVPGVDPQVPPLTLPEADAVAFAAQAAGVTALRLVDHTPGVRTLDPSVVAGYLAGRYGGLGVIVEVPTTHHAPYNVARRIAGLDRATDGWAGVSVRPGGGDEISDAIVPDPTADDPAERWVEYAAVLVGLFESFPRSALLGDVEQALVVDDAQIHPIEFEGRFYRVRGPLDGPTSGQRPVVLAVDPGVLGWGRVAAHADVVVVGRDASAGADAALRDAARAAGRDRAELALVGRVTAPAQSVTELRGWLEADRLDALGFAPAGDLEQTLALLSGPVRELAPARAESLRASLRIGLPVEVAS